KTGLGQLIFACKVVLTIAYGHDGGAGWEQRGCPLIGLARQRLAVGQGNEGLCMPFARYRPETGSRTAGQNHGQARHTDDSLLTRRRSASTIMSMSSARLVFALQPSLRCALAGWPSRTSTSAGRK